ncbi:uncharacterized protein C8A04DRAFT_24563 [Dichotomopilus funicola]|uniref:Uncharacterized protein n=1 Tax=Dichotomopilus funicola TaxID=1934379 RepID=A0AAN6VA73_9PEZI|nr:hypothetical protein C8A04DRAFT_24563 [Dichotomopilus funicola]
MDQDQFGGRTDDDLFSDDIELVDETVEYVVETAPVFDAPAVVEAAPAPAPPPAPATTEPTPVVAPQPRAAPSQPARSSLAQSRHAPKPAAQENNNNNNNKPPRSSKKHNNAKKGPKPSSRAVSETPSGSESIATTAATPAPDTPAATDKPEQPQSTPVPSGPATATESTTTNNHGNTASAVSHARLSSGANPRQKLTETELAARMEKMRLLAAEKTRRFEEAQRDASEHDVAYEIGMEEARKRRAEEASRRKAAEEERRKLEVERAKNRERKLKAMGMKEGGGWDAGKEERERQEDAAGNGFRGANGGVRGARSGGGGDRGGLGASRFSAGGDGGEADVRGEFDGFGIRGRGMGMRGRGRVRGRGGRGGGRALFDEHDGEHHGGDHSRRGEHHTAQAPAPPKKVDLKKEDFPALPSSNAAPKKIDTAWGKQAGVAELPLSPPVGKWDEEVEATLAKET